MNRRARANIAKQTCQIIQDGQYTNRQGKIVNISTELKHAVENTTIYWQNDTLKIQTLLNQYLVSKSNKTEFQTVIEVQDETTLQAAQRLTSEGFQNVVCLNFASAKNPGGGFLGGSSAQEESLARASGLYACQQGNFSMYEDNREQNSAVYTDHMMYSPKVPIFRDSQDELLEEPYFVSFITAPAVNVGLVQTRNPELIQQVEEIMVCRIERVLSIGLINEADAIVLGAWGCGVFMNDPIQIAKYFAQIVFNDERFVNQYRKIVFAVPAGSLGHLEVFQNQFEK